LFRRVLGHQGGAQNVGRDHTTVALQMNLSFAASGGEKMQFLPGFTVQCINPLCDARGHWLRADATTPLGSEGRCPCCGDFLRNVPPPLSPRFRMRPRSLTARPPLRPRPREGRKSVAQLIAPEIHRELFRVLGLYLYERASLD